MQRKQTFLRDLNPGETVGDFFALADARLGQGRNGPFWSLTLEDASGRMEAKVFSPLAHNVGELASGMVVRLCGAVQTFRDQPQIVVEALEVLEGEPPPDILRGLIAFCETDPLMLYEELKELVTTHMRHKPWRSFCLGVLRREEIRSRMLTTPGGKAMHHAYAGGLLEHTLSVARLCMSICDLYPQLDRETLLAGAVFHDLGKAWELTSGLSRDYTDEGRLLGHLHLGLHVLEPFLAKATKLSDELKLHFRHLLLSHHGEYEYGSPKRPKTAEAFVLHYADNLDAKMNTIASTLRETPDGKSWTPFQRSLGRFLYRPAVTPGQEAPDKPEDEGQQCFLPLKG